MDFSQLGAWAGRLPLERFEPLFRRVELAYGQAEVYPPQFRYSLMNLIGGGAGGNSGAGSLSRAGSGPWLGVLRADGGKSTAVSG